MARDALPLDGLDLNLLVTLRAILREGSVTRAAETLGQTQPTVSRSLNLLRAAFDDPLFVRAGRGLAPTPMAQSLRTPLERTLASLDRLKTVGAFDPTTAERVFRLTLPDVLGALVVPALIARLHAEAPGVALQILGSERDALRDLLDDEVDLVIGALVLDHAELYTRSPIQEGLGWSVLFGPRHPAAQSDPPAEMTLERWLSSTHVQIAPAGRPDTPSPLDALLAARGLQRRIGLHLGYVSALPGVLLSTPYVTSLPTPVARHLQRGTALHAAPHPFPDTRRLSVRLTWHEARHTDAGHRWLREQVAHVVANLGTPS